VLSRRRATFTTRDIFKAPLSAAEIRALARLAPGGVRDLLSTRSTPYRTLGLDRNPVSDDTLVTLMAREPRLLRRPLVVAGDRLVIGFDRAALEALTAG
jgi:arsenate reductase-like glutaredoxin family protein